jgi:hypothetical protein
VRISRIRLSMKLSAQGMRMNSPRGESQEHQPQPLKVGV